MFSVARRRLAVLAAIPAFTNSRGNCAMKLPKSVTLACAGAVFSFGTVAQAADVVIGVPNWPSVLATAHVLKAVSYTHLTLPTKA